MLCFKMLNTRGALNNMYLMAMPFKDWLPNFEWSKYKRAGGSPFIFWQGSKFGSFDWLPNFDRPKFERAGGQPVHTLVTFKHTQLPKLP